MITSFITGRPIMGFDPAGYVQFVEPSAEYLVTNHNLVREYDETTFFMFASGITDNQIEFLDALRLDLDTNYAATSFTDSARNYILDYRVVKVERTFNAPSTNIWEEREYVWKVTVSVRVNTNA